MCFILFCTDDETFVCNFTLPVAISYMHKAFVNMVLTEKDEIVVPLCLIVIALAMQHLKRQRIIRIAGQDYGFNEDMFIGLTMLC